MAQPLYVRKSTPGIRRIGEWIERQSRSERFRENKYVALMGFEPRTVQHGTVDFPFPELHKKTSYFMLKGAAGADLSM